MEFQTIKSDNFDQVLRIYKEGIDTGLATFETSLPSWEKWDREHFDFGRITLEDGGEVLGWASLAPVSGRCAYSGVAEVSVYVGDGQQGKGIGTRLLEQLIAESETNGIWTLHAAIMRSNVGSLKLHEKCGFRTIGYREKIGLLNGIWTDNVLMERRSKVVGV